jgi:hypothetical protein
MKSGNGKSVVHVPSHQEVIDWQAQLRRALFEALDANVIREVVGAMVEKAKKGDIAAARLVLTYAVGNPTVNVKNAVFMGGNGHAGVGPGAGLNPSPNPNPAPLPAAPTRALPGTPEKFDVLANRAQGGKALFDSRDRVRSGD